MVNTCHIIWLHMIYCWPYILSLTSARYVLICNLLNINTHETFIYQKVQPCNFLNRNSIRMHRWRFRSVFRHLQKFEGRSPWGVAKYMRKNSGYCTMIKFLFFSCSNYLHDENFFFMNRLIRWRIVYCTLRRQFQSPQPERVTGTPQPSVDIQRCSSCSARSALPALGCVHVEWGASSIK